MARAARRLPRPSRQPPPPETAATGALVTAGYPQLAEHIDEGKALNVSCRVVTRASEDGQYINVEQAAVFRDKKDPVAIFEQIWKEARDYDLDDGQRDSWEKFCVWVNGSLKNFC